MRYGVARLSVLLRLVQHFAVKKDYEAVELDAPWHCQQTLAVALTQPK